MFVSTLVRGAVLAALLVPCVGLGQSAPTAQLPPTAPAAPPAASPAAAQPASAAPSAATQTAVDQRIRALQSQLGITEAQMPLWTAFAQRWEFFPSIKKGRSCGVGEPGRAGTARRPGLGTQSRRRAKPR